jgi:O-acetyl-ADP-ribose deacetylase (regulator of RNase III)
MRQSKTVATYRAGGARLLVVEGDISLSTTAAVVNAANPASFTPMDGGVSGALRNACLPDNVIGKDKMCWPEDEGEPTTSPRVEPHHAGAHRAAGRLASQGVQWIVHAVGPVWKEYPAEAATFDVVGPLIYDTCRRALATAVKCGATSVTIPALSGGSTLLPGTTAAQPQQPACPSRCPPLSMRCSPCARPVFTHFGPPAIAEREQYIARAALARAIDEHLAAGSRLQTIVLIVRSAMGPAPAIPSPPPPPHPHRSATPAAPEGGACPLAPEGGACPLAAAGASACVSPPGVCVSPPGVCVSPPGMPSSCGLTLTRDEARAGDARAGDARAGDARAGDARAGDARAGDARAGDARAGDAHAG